MIIFTIFSIIRNSKHRDKAKMEDCVGNSKQANEKIFKLVTRCI